MTRKQITASLRQHRLAVCDYRFVWRVAPEHQRAGWRNAALTHESLVRSYSRDLAVHDFKAAHDGLSSVQERK